MSHFLTFPDDFVLKFDFDGEISHRRTHEEDDATFEVYECHAMEQSQSYRDRLIIFQ